MQRVDMKTHGSHHTWYKSIATSVLSLVMSTGKGFDELLLFPLTG